MACPPVLPLLRPSSATITRDAWRAATPFAKHHRDTAAHYRNCPLPRRSSTITVIIAATIPETSQPILQLPRRTCVRTELICLLFYQFCSRRKAKSAERPGLRDRIEYRGNTIRPHVRHPLGTRRWSRVRIRESLMRTHARRYVHEIDVLTWVQVVSGDPSPGVVQRFR